MNKFLSFSLVLLCTVVMGISLASCGDDEPLVSTDFAKTELTTPMFLFEQPNGVVSSITNGFNFWTFTDGKAAYGTFTRSNNRAVLKCNELYDSWSLEGGKLQLGNVTRNVKKVSVLGAKAFTIDLTVFIPSNLSVGGFTAETVFTELSLNKQKLWQGLERAKQEGPIYVDEI